MYYNTATNINFFMTTTSGTAANLAASAITVKLSKNAGAGTTPTCALTLVSGFTNYYNLPITAAETSANSLAIQASGSGCINYEQVFYINSDYTEQKAGFLDSAVSSRASSSIQNVIDTLNINTSGINTNVLTRLATSGYTAPSTSVNVSSIDNSVITSGTFAEGTIATVSQQSSAIRVEMDTNSTKLDTNVGSRLATSGYSPGGLTGSVQVSGINAGVINTTVAPLLSALDTPVSTRMSSSASVVATVESVNVSSISAGIIDIAVAPLLSALDTTVSSRMSSGASVTAQVGSVNVSSINNGIIDIAVAPALSALDVNVSSRMSSGASLTTTLNSSDIINMANQIVSMVGTTQITITSPISQAGNTITLYRAADYLETTTELAWTLEGFPDLTDKSVNFNLAGLGSVTCVITNAGSGSQIVELELPHSITASLSAGSYQYSLTVHKDDVVYPELLIGNLTIYSIPGLS